MARGKKAAKELSPEEKLQQALVPVEEQPYLIPENWCWVRLGKLYEINPKVTADNAALASFVPMERIESGMTGRFTFEIQSWEKARKNHTQFADGDVAFAKISPCFENQKSMIVQGLKNGIGGGTTELIILRQAYMNQKYTFLLISTEDFVSQGKATYSGTVGQQRISMDFVREYPVPVPPLPEQHRIVNCIESLFAKLDEAKEKAQAVVDGFELRKSAILHKAFTGELTERWRKEYGVGLDSWETKTSKELFEYVTSGSRGWAQYYSETGAVFVRMGNLGHGTIELDFSNIQHVCLPDKAEGQRSRLQNNDILISITADVGMVGLVREMDFEAYINQHIALARPNNENDPEFIAWYLVSDVGLRQMQGKQRGATKVGLGLDDIRSLQLSMPKISEQKKVVAVLNKLMNKEQQAKEAAEAVLSQIDTMKKAILARAFRGELGTNDPAEESSVELLREVLETEVPKPPRARAAFIPEELEKRLESELERKIIKLYLKSDSATLAIDVLMAVSSKKFEVMDTLRNLEQRGIIKKLNNGNYSLVR